MNEAFTKYLKLFKQNQKEGLYDRTIDRKTHEISKLLDYLESKEIYNFNGFDIREIYNYLNSLTHASQTKSGIQFTIREFFNSMKKHGICEFDGYQIFPVIFTNKRDRILSYYKTDEIKDIISQIDIGKLNGLRDKCMILLAAQTGLRSSDILELTFNEILWDKGTIHKIQQKTTLPVSVPLPENIKYLLIDYIKNKHPVSEKAFIFINPESMDGYSMSELYAILNKYINKSSVTVGNRKHGPWYQ